MKSVKELDEQLDDLAVKARSIHEAAEGRQFSAEESAEFNNITDVLIPSVQAEKATALKRQEAVARLEKESDRKARAGQMEEILNRPSRVLPTNGRLPGEEDDEPQDRIYVRHARLQCFKTDREAYDAGMWLRNLAAREWHRDDVKAQQHCQKRGLQLTNTMSEGTGAGGGYLVPTQVASSIIAIRESVGVARRVCKILPMSSDTLTLPKRTSGLTVYAPGEATAITASDIAVQQIELINKKRAVLAQISQELNDDALVSMADLVFTEMAYALATQEDKELINGTGAAATYFGVRGLLNRIGSAGVSTATTGNDTWPEISMADIVATIGLLPERYDMNPSWICSRNFYHGVMVRLEAAGGGNTIATLRQGAQGTPAFLGYPVYFTSQMPTATGVSTVSALFGAFEQAVVLGDRGGITMQRDDSYGFNADLITFKATSRYDFNVHEPGDSSNAGAYVALKTAS